MYRPRAGLYDDLRPGRIRASAVRGEFRQQICLTRSRKERKEVWIPLPKKRPHAQRRKSQKRRIHPPAWVHAGLGAEIASTHRMRGRRRYEYAERRLRKSVVCFRYDDCPAVCGGSAAIQAGRTFVSTHASPCSETFSGAWFYEGMFREEDRLVPQLL